LFTIELLLLVLKLQLFFELDMDCLKEPPDLAEDVSQVVEEFCSGLGEWC
jgi:hypothetical protein